MRRLLAIVALTALAAPAAFAKEGARAHLLAPLPAHPAAGTLITVRWRVDVPGPNGTRVPFGAVGMFVRVVGRDGVAQDTVAAAYRPPYAARIRVHAGGIRVLRLGLRGTSCGLSGCRPSPIFFPLR